MKSQSKEGSRQRNLTAKKSHEGNQTEKKPRSKAVLQQRKDTTTKAQSKEATQRSLRAKKVPQQSMPSDLHWLDKEVTQTLLDCGEFIIYNVASAPVVRPGGRPQEREWEAPCNRSGGCHRV